MIAYNANLNTTSVRRANSVAFDVRENGRPKTEDGTPWGKKILDANGEEVREPGMLKSVKAIGWMVEEYGIAQVSMNLIAPEITGPMAVYDAVAALAPIDRAELVGLVPARVLAEIPRSRWAELDLSNEKTIEWKLAQRNRTLQS
mgnify:CR=1 FL=1